MSKISTSRFTIVNDVHVHVPVNENLMTNFILQEQGDWFEDEIKFVRNFIKPGMNVIDIGANYGVYTLTIAKMIGKSGKLWAFEPTDTTAFCLRKSIAENKLDNIELIQAGLSDKIGEATFFTSPNSELNSLTQDAGGGESETISLLTLDHCMKKFEWDRIDFIKLDAEGEDCNILTEARETFSSFSPMIMFELKHGEHVNLPLIERFKGMGLDCYRLLPGLNILVPFDHRQPFDGYLLNLFACDKKRASQLESEGVIVQAWDVTKLVDNVSLAEQFIGDLKCGSSLKKHLPPASDSSDDYMAILNGYIMSLSNSESNVDRVSYLMSALAGARRMIAKGEGRIERLVPFARIAIDAGERALGVEVLGGLINRYNATINFEVDELLLPACKRFDDVDPKVDINKWLYSSILETYIKQHAFSCYFTEKTTLPFFAGLDSLGFISEEMRNRFTLVFSHYPQ